MAIAEGLKALLDLIVLKMLSFRKQDHLDIENLLTTGTPIDLDYLEKTIKGFNLDWKYIEQHQS